MLDLSPDSSTSLAQACTGLVCRVLNAKHWRPARLAQELGVHPDLVRRWVRGERRPQLDDLLTMARMVNASLDEVFGLRTQNDSVGFDADSIVERVVGAVALELQRALPGRAQLEAASAPARAGGTGIMANEAGDHLNVRAREALEQLVRGTTATERIRTRRLA